MDIVNMLLVWLVVLSVAYLVRLLWSAAKPPPKPLKMASFQVGDVTPDSLRYYCGYDYMKPILVAVCGKAYDVTKDAKLYGPGKELHAYAGKEIARALAKGNLEEDDMNDKLEDLTEEEKQQLEVKVEELGSKYDVVGKVVPMKHMSLKELEAHDGSDSALPLYLSIQGTIYNVSKGSMFYGPDGAYPFAGRECARALALMSTELSDCNDKVDDLPPHEKETLRDWIGRFSVKYPIVGKTVVE